MCEDVHQDTSLQVAEKCSKGVKTCQGTDLQVVKKVLVCEDMYQGTSLLVP